MEGVNSLSRHQKAEGEEARKLREACSKARRVCPIQDSHDSDAAQSRPWRCRRPGLSPTTTRLRRHVSPSLQLRPQAGVPQPFPQLYSRKAQADPGNIPCGRPGTRSTPSPNPSVLTYVQFCSSYGVHTLPYSLRLRTGRSWTPLSYPHTPMLRSTSPTTSHPST